VKNWTRIVVVLALLVGVSALAAEPVKVFLEDDGSAGKVHALTLKDQGLHPNESFFYTESYFMIAISDSGYYGYVNFLISSMGVSPNTPAVSFTVVTPEHKRLAKDVDFKPEDLKMAKDRFELTLKDNVFKQTADGYAVKVGADNLGLELNFVNRVPGLVLGNGKAEFGKDQKNIFYINYPGPRPEFTGKFIVEGKEIPVKGWGYLDHSVTTSNPGDYQKVWHNFKFRSDTNTVLISSFTSPERFERGFSVAVVTDATKVLCTSTDVRVKEEEVKPDADSGKAYANRVSYEAVGDQCKGRAVIDTSKPTEKFDVLAKLDQKWWGKAAKVAINTFLAKPWYFRAVAPVEVEIEMGGKTEKVKGTAFNEIIFSN
jgi:hypothetical protein